MIKNAVCQTYFQTEKLCSTHGKLTTTTFHKNNRFIVNGSVWTPGTTETGNMQPYENKLTKYQNCSLKFKIMIHRSRCTCTCTCTHLHVFLSLTSASSQPSSPLF